MATTVAPTYTHVTEASFKNDLGQFITVVTCITRGVSDLYTTPDRHGIARGTECACGYKF